MGLGLGWQRWRIYRPSGAYDSPHRQNLPGGTSSYGISGFEAMVHDAHNFQSHYLFELSGVKVGKEGDKE